MPSRSVTAIDRVPEGSEWPEEPELEDAIGAVEPVDACMGVHPDMESGDVDE